MTPPPKPTEEIIEKEFPSDKYYGSMWHEAKKKFAEMLAVEFERGRQKGLQETQDILLNKWVAREIEHIKGKPE